ncbi:putative G2/mitotic-specific cyclin-4 [Amylocarpus encephaloides]|uniref:G2/mitotic-specific cyclin-4 n=1 Tax=Amylocarpus encephaloides TaxID=45428 RepID=A0A9P7YN07_9HELO|nr:putative G2/mitotic-specific cyclin-4 [Amylocarpus encephaloides]
MDARPQRGIRPLRLLVDENCAPVASKQSLHQRHKSTGTLSSMLQVGGLKAAAKRTAFGDVSNTTKSLRIHDDSAIPTKTTKAEIVKPLAYPEKPTALLRPAQRPLQAAPVKLTSHSVLQDEPIPGPAVSKVTLKESRPLAPAPVRKVSKKNNIVYQDTSADEVAKPRPATNHVAAQEAAPVAPVRQTLEPRHHKSQPQLNGARVAVDEAEAEKSHGIPDVHSNITPNDAVYGSASEEQGITSGEAYEKYLKMVERKEEEEHAFDASACVVYDREHPALPAPPQRPEPEEYWEDEEEVYDEQGYTTAHSYRSRGDNTTSGATTVLFPKITNKIKKEIAAAADVVENARTQDEIEDEAWDTSMVAEYGDEIFTYMRELEVSFCPFVSRLVDLSYCLHVLFPSPSGMEMLTDSLQLKMLPNAHYMDNQAEIQWSMRSVLMDWLIQVHHRFSLLPETLFLCVNYIDRFLSCKIVSLGKLQLVGATAIFVAAKYEEINCPSVSEIVYMVDGGYTVDEILKAERFMLSMLQFELGWPGPMSFLRRISKADDYDLETRTLAKYFLEVTIMDERFVGSPPSYIAAGAHCLARLMLKKGDWVSFPRLDPS